MTTENPEVKILNPVPEPWPLTHLVTTFMTLEEIEARKALPTPGMRNHVRLVFYTKYSGESYGDDHVPQIIFDAAKECGRLPEGWEGGESREAADWLLDFNPYGLPTLMKIDLLSSIEGCWCPENQSSLSEWVADRDAAEDLFVQMPELLMAFAHDAEAVGAAWLERNAEGTIV